MADEHLEDVRLARRCADGDAEALAELDRRYRGEFAGALSRLQLTASEIDDVTQAVRERLFVHGRIRDYAGRGSLAGFLRAVIVRAGIDHRRARRPVAGLDDEPLVDALAATDDPEVEALRRRFIGPFRAAFREAVRALPPDERNALRLNAVEGLNIAQIGALYGVHRATVARWIAHAREAISGRTRRRLEEQLGLSKRDLDSLLYLCSSRLELGWSDLASVTSVKTEGRG